jgi:plasmid stabilization system protein ParE
MRNYFLSPIAEQDIDDIVSYLGAENIDAALRNVHEIRFTSIISY